MLIRYGAGWHLVCYMAVYERNMKFVEVYIRRPSLVRMGIVAMLECRINVLIAAMEYRIVSARDALGTSILPVHQYFAEDSS